MYRENTFEVFKSRHDNFNFAKVLKKRKEFYKMHSSSDPTDREFEINSKLSYCNDNFLNNCNDKRLVVEITKGDPTYENQRLYQRIKHNNELIFRNTNYSKYSNLTSNFGNRSDIFSSGSTKDSTKINICVGENKDVMIYNPEALNSHRFIRRSMKTKPEYTSIDQGLDQFMLIEESKFDNPLSTKIFK